MTRDSGLSQPQPKAAKRLRKIPPKLKDELRMRAGGKCANPGCANWNTHIHHIKHWAVYKTHSSNDMIAICPACHDAVHSGTLEISDATVYEWRNFARDPATTAHIWVEPAEELHVIAGSCWFAAASHDAVVSNIGPNNLFGFKILDKNILLVDIVVRATSGEQLLRVVQNNVRVHADTKVRLEQRPGRVRVTVPNSDRYLPRWALERVQDIEPDYGTDERIVALDLEVTAPGRVKAMGFVMRDESSGVVYTESRIVVCIRDGGPVVFQNFRFICFEHNDASVLGFDNPNSIFNVVR